MNARNPSWESGYPLRVIVFSWKDLLGLEEASKETRRHSGMSGSKRMYATTLLSWRKGKRIENSNGRDNSQENVRPLGEGCVNV